jgi:Holliday junction resolvase RusA-like endonuclease
MARCKEYVIEITPIPWKRAGIRERVFYDKQTHEKLAFGLYLNKQHGNDPKFQNPLSVDITFYMPIPKSVNQRSKYRWHHSVPDIDNLSKFCLDAINNSGLIWTDDRQVSELTARKLYDQKPRTHLIIRELE